MARNYLTTHFVFGFVRDCSILELEVTKQTDLVRIATEMQKHYSRFVTEEDFQKRMGALFVAIAYLRDCKDLLERSKVIERGVWIKYFLLEGRLSQLFLDGSLEEGGQMRMLG